METRTTEDEDRRRRVQCADLGDGKVKSRVRTTDGHVTRKDEEVGLFLDCIEEPGLTERG